MTCSFCLDKWNLPLHSLWIKGQGNNAVLNQEKQKQKDF